MSPSQVRALIAAHNWWYSYNDDTVELTSGNITVSSEGPDEVTAAVSAIERMMNALKK